MNAILRLEKQSYYYEYKFYEIFRFTTKLPKFPWDMDYYYTNQAISKAYMTRINCNGDYSYSLLIRIRDNRYYTSNNSFKLSLPKRTIALDYKDYIIICIDSGRILLKIYKRGRV